jgi:hypothetical protein
MMRIARAVTALLILIQVPVLEAACKCVCQGQRAYPLCDDPRELIPICSSDPCGSSSSREESLNYEALNRQLKPVTSDADGRGGSHIDNVRGHVFKPPNGTIKGCQMIDEFDPKTMRMVKRQYCP